MRSKNPVYMPSGRMKSKRKKRNSETNRSLYVETKRTPVSKKKISSLIQQNAPHHFNKTQNLNQTICTTGMREMRRSMNERY